MAIIKIRNEALDLDAAEIPSLDTSKITTGTFVADRIDNTSLSSISKNSLFRCNTRLDSNS
jgi:hypothetical protein